MQPYRRHPCWPEKRRCNCVRQVLAVLFVSGLWDSADVYASTSPDGSDVPLLLFSGFGTLGAVHSNNDRADFTGGFFQPNGAGYTHSWSTDVDSLIAGPSSKPYRGRVTTTLTLRKWSGPISNIRSRRT